MRSLKERGWNIVFASAVVLAAAVLFPLLALGHAAAGPFTPQPASDQGRSIDDLYTIIFVVAVVIFVLVEGAILYMILRYRKRDDTLPEQTHGNLPIEIVWTAVPLIIVAVLFGLSWKTLNDVQAKPDPDLTVNVQGFQWQWRFTYPQQDIDIVGTPDNPPEMVLPTGQNVKLVLSSDDVIHSFYVPQFLYKLDVVPGRANTFTVKLVEEGILSGQCAEFCGLDHARMLFRVRALSPAQFEAWVSEQQASAAPVPTVTPAVPTTTIDIAAKNVLFDTDTLEAPAVQPFTIEFDNQDATIPHNVSIYTDASATESLFTGEIFPGPDSRTYQVPALDAGTYFFRCDVHPTQMTGALNVR